MLVVILNDGETYTDFNGAVLLRVPETVEGDDVDQYVKEHYEDGTDIGALLPGHFDLIK